MTLLSRMTGVFFPDQVDCVPVMALAGRHVFDSTLVDLGDCPYKALAARILRGPQIQARLRIGFQLAIGFLSAVIPIRVAFVHYTVTGFFAIAQTCLEPAEGMTFFLTTCFVTITLIFSQCSLYILRESLCEIFWLRLVREISFSFTQGRLVQ